MGRSIVLDNEKMQKCKSIIGSIKRYVLNYVYSHIQYSKFENTIS